MFELVRAGFATRRKTLRNALTTVFGARAEEVLRAAGIDPMRRAETLTLEDWAQVAAVPA
jgi:16S rRNA (adenine1518-N6/adenine1519-N6)-dimethyltransferase